MDRILSIEIFACTVHRAGLNRIISRGTALRPGSNAIRVGDRTTDGKQNCTHGKQKYMHGKQYYSTRMRNKYWTQIWETEVHTPVVLHTKGTTLTELSSTHTHTHRYCTLQYSNRNLIYTTLLVHKREWKLHIRITTSLTHYLQKSKVFCLVATLSLPPPLSPLTLSTPSVTVTTHTVFTLTLSVASHSLPLITCPFTIFLSHYSQI